MEYRKIFSEHLAALRKQKNVSLMSLGQHLGVTDEAVRLLEKGKRLPSFEVLCALADYFDVPVDYLLGRGLFAYWDDIVKYRLPIIEQMEKDIPSMKEHHLKTWPEKALMRFLPAFLDAVIVQNDTLQLFYYSG